MSSASHGESLYQTSSVATVCLYSAQPFPSPCHLAKLKKKKKNHSHLRVSSIFKNIEIFNFHINWFCLYSKVDSTILQMRKLRYPDIKSWARGLPWQSSSWGLDLPMQVVWVWPLVGDLGSHRPCDQKNQNTCNRESFVTNSIKTLK